MRAAEFRRPSGSGAERRPLLGAALAATLYAVAGLGSIADAWIASFAPGRAPILLAMLAGTLPFFLADEWLTRGAGAPRWAYLASKEAFCLSLALAVALDPGRLFFLVIMVPAIVLLFLIDGLLSALTYKRTGYPAVGALTNAVALPGTSASPSRSSRPRDRDAALIAPRRAEPMRQQ